MRTRAQTARLGVFVAVAGGLLFSVLAVLSGTALFQQQDRYTIFFSETVSGLEVGAAVKLLGVRVGRIESFRVVPRDGEDRVEVTVELFGGTPIREDAEARLSGSGITGLMFVEITGGTSATPLREPGSEIPAGPSLLGTLTGKAENIAVKLEEVLNRVLSLTTNENVENVRLTLDNVRTSSAELRGMLTELDEAVDPLVAASHDVGPAIEEVRAAAVSVRETSEALASDGALRASVEQLERTLQTAQNLLGGDRAAQLSDDVRTAVQSFTETMNRLSEVLGSSSRDFRDISSSLRDASENLEEFARAIREDPSLLIRSSQGGD